MERCSNIINKRNANKIMRYHFVPINQAVIREVDVTHCCRGCEVRSILGGVDTTQLLLCARVLIAGDNLMFLIRGRWAKCEREPPWKTILYIETTDSVFIQEHEQIDLNFLKPRAYPSLGLNFLSLSTIQLVMPLP